MKLRIQLAYTVPTWDYKNLKSFTVVGLTPKHCIAAAKAELRAFLANGSCASSSNKVALGFKSRVASITEA